MWKWETPVSLLDCQTYTVKRLDCGRTVRYRMMTRERHEMPIVNLSKDEYLLKKTGEVRKKVHAETKGQTISSVKRAFSRLYDICECNYESNDQVLFLTLTYSQMMEDEKRLRLDVAVFNKALKRMGYEYRYVWVPEKQGNGRWHVHMIMFFDDKAPWLTNALLDSAWKKGFWNLKRDFSDVRNLAAYICADLSWSDGGDTHKVNKVNRLMGYSAGLHLYRCSKNIRRPVESDISYDDYLSEEKGIMIYDKAYTVVTDQDYKCTYRYASYEKKNRA